MAISDPEARAARPLEDWLRDLLDAGVDVVQVREKALDDRDLLALARRVRETTGGAARVVVNRRLDIALAAGCDGVHLPAAGLPVARLRRCFGPAVLIGRSTHHPDEVAAARDDGADYVTFGPVFATPSKARYGPPPGLAGLRAAAAHGLPVIALGGIEPARVAAVAAAGASGIAAIRACHDPDRLRALVAAVRRAWPPPATPTTTPPSMAHGDGRTR